MQNEFDYKKYLYLMNKNKKLFVITALAIMTIAVLISYLMPKKYEAKSTVFIEKNIISELVKGIAVTSSMEDTVKMLTYAISSRTLMTKVMNDLDINAKNQSDAQQEATITNLQKHLDVKLKDKENLFIISFTDESPRFARDFVNTLIRLYIEENVSSKRNESYGATSFLSEQIASFKGKMDKTEADISKYKNEKGAVIAADEGKIQEEIRDSQQRLDDLVLKRSQLEAQRNQLKKNNPVRVRLLALQRRLEELRLEYTDNYPEIIKVKGDIASAKEELRSRVGSGESAVSDPQELERIDAELRAIRISESNQRSLLAYNRGLLREGPIAKAGLEKLEQERSNNKNMYEQLVNRHGQAEVSKQIEVQDKSTVFRIVDPAVTPVKPISPNRVRIILLGMLAGLAGGLGLLVLLDYMDHSVKAVDTLKPLGIPVMAIIPRIGVQEETMKERERDLKLYRVAGCYFAVILCILAMEALNISLVDRVVRLISS